MEKAIKNQKRAIDLLKQGDPDPKDLKEYQEFLQAYQSYKPWQE